MPTYPDYNRRIALKSIEEERLARPVTYLSKEQKNVLNKVAEGIYENSDGVPHESITAAALRTLETLGLVHLISTKDGIEAKLTDKGRLLLHENKKLNFPIPENTRWKITTAIAIAAIVIALGSLIIAALSLKQQFGQSI